jgi:hypothetical protein
MDDIQYFPDGPISPELGPQICSFSEDNVCIPLFHPGERMPAPPTFLSPLRKAPTPAPRSEFRQKGILKQVVTQLD